MNKTNTSRLWGKGDKFTFDGYTFVVKDVDINGYYQTDYKNYFLCYDRRVNGRYLRHWINADLVIKKEKAIR